MVLWSIVDTTGMLRHFKIKAYYVPSSKIRLLSLHALLQHTEREKITVENDCLILSGVADDRSCNSVRVPFHPVSRLPISTAYRYNDLAVNFLSPVADAKAIYSASSVVSQSNSNLSNAEKELLRWHFKLGHIAFSKVQALMRTGVLSHSEGTLQLHHAAATLSTAPKCAACTFAKQRVRPSPGRKISTIHDTVGALRSNNVYPGQEVSVDHFICSTKGRLFSSRGKTKDNDMYCGGCIFVDHCSNYIFIEFQKTLHSHATVASKESFEAHARDYGVLIQKYLCDNGTAFTSNDFQKHLQSFHQHIRFAGVGAHHHNGHAERAISTIMSISRAMLIHSALHWPEVSDAALWPMCVAHAVYIWNHVPSPSTGLSPADLFTKSRWKLSQFLDLHVFGCPTYVLDHRLSDGKKIPRWTPRSTRCIYLGKSPVHASTVPLVLNPSTGSITTQFHVVFDDWFNTVSSSVENLPNFNDDEWQKMFGDSQYQYFFDDLDLENVRALTDEVDSSLDDLAAQQARDRVHSAIDTIRPPQPFPAPVSPASPLSPSSAPPSSSVVTSPVPLGSTPTPSPRPVGEQTPRFKDSPSAQPSTRSRPITSAQPTMGSRNVPDLMSHSQPIKSPSPSQFSTAKVQGLRHSAQSTSKATGTPPPPLRRSARLQAKRDAAAALPPAASFLSLFTAFGISPLSVLKASTNPDIFTYEEAMNSTFKDEFIKVAQLEVSELEQHGTWKEVLQSSATGRIIPCTWVFSIKRRPDGSIKKFKARLCLRGDLQKGQFDTYAPVASFSTIRIFLITALMFGWETCTIDFSNAFVQALVQTDVWMHLPRGFVSKRSGTCLKLIRSLYGAAFSPRLWYEHLTKIILELGFTKSNLDPCLFLKPNIYLIIYVDDVGIAYKTECAVTELMKQLEKKGLRLTRESSFSEYLGISYEKKSDGTLELTQKGLIKKIISAVGLEKCKPNWTPASTECLGLDPTGAPMSDDWLYASVVGMLLYLSSNTRPDICFAVSQVARFSHSPRQSHASAVKTIVRYLSGTADKGTLLSVPSSFQITAFPDSDFAGLFQRDPDDSPSSAKSRSGYVIKFCNSPLLWKSQLQPSIALSTSESEYYSLSQCMRSLLPIRSLLLEFFDVVDAPAPFDAFAPNIQTVVFVDNTSALALAREQNITSRNRHYHCRFHFFWSYVRDGTVSVDYVNTTNQDGDYLTKGLARVPFESNRFRVQGW